MKFKVLTTEDKLLPLVPYKGPTKTVIDFRKEWYIKESEHGPRTARIPQYALIEYTVLKQGNDVHELLKETNKQPDSVFTALTLEEAEQFKLKVGEGFLK